MFIFKGVSSDDMDIVVNKLPSIEIPQREVEEVELDGKDGTYTIVKNYKTTTKKIEVHYEGDNWDSLSFWLQGNGELVLGNLTDRYYKAYIKGSIPLEQIIKNKLSKFIITFVCQPFGYFLDNREIPLDEGLNKFNNFGTVNCEPIIYIKARGDVVIKTINSEGVEKLHHIKDIDDYITIDSVNKICHKDNENQSNKLTGDYISLTPMINDILITGNVSDVRLLPNMRYLV